MSVAGAADILGAGGELYCHHALGNHGAGVGADYMNAEEPVGRGIGQYLYSPSVSPLARARALAVKGNLPTLYDVPAAFNSSSVLPTLATSGAV